MAETHNIRGVQNVFQYYWLGSHPVQSTRKESYLKYYDRPDLQNNNQSLFDSRRKMSNALGFDSFAERALLLAAPKGKVLTLIQKLIIIIQNRLVSFIIFIVLKNINDNFFNFSQNS